MSAPRMGAFATQWIAGTFGPTRIASPGRTEGENEMHCETEPIYERDKSKEELKRMIIHIDTLFRVKSSI